MTEIPEDIMQAANECVAQFRWNNDNQWHLFVARAILAERAEARRKALDEAATLIDEGFDRPGIVSKHDLCDHKKFEWQDCEQCAAAAIRALIDKEATG